MPLVLMESAHSRLIRKRELVLILGYLKPPPHTEPNPAQLLLLPHPE